MSFPILMSPPGRSTFTQSGLIELGKPVETLPDGQFVEAKKPREPRKRKDAEPEIPQPFVGPPPIISGAGKARGQSGEPDAPLKVFTPVVAGSEMADVDITSRGQAASGIHKTTKTPFIKGSEEAKAHMARIRKIGQEKKAAEKAAAEEAAKAIVAARDAAAKKAKATKKAKKLEKKGAEDDAGLATLRGSEEARERSLAAITPAKAAPAPAAAAKPKKTRKAKSAAAAAAATDEEDADLILANELLESTKPKKAKKHKNNPTEAEVALLQRQLADMTRRIADATRR